jgi:hypothetical protein
MPPIAPIKLTLYDPKTSEVDHEESTAFIPTGIFTELARMMKTIDLTHPEELEEETIESLYALVAGLFGNRITIDQIKQGTDLGEFMAVITNIMARVGAEFPENVQANPTLPGTRTRGRKR